MELISSRNNPRIKKAALLMNSSERAKTGLFLIEGARLCFDAAANGIEIEEAYFTAQAENKYSQKVQTIKQKAKFTAYINESVAEKLSDTKNSQDIFCVCRQKRKSADFIEADKFYIMTENVQTPDNLGAIVRSAEALGADGLAVFSGCDIYSPKALRASMGALLRFPVFTVNDAVEFIKECNARSMKTYATVPDSSARDIARLQYNGGCVAVIGNEGNGVSEEVKNECSEAVTIPMKGKAESLNAASAAAIIIYEFMKSR